MMKNLYCVSYGGGHINIINEVVAYLDKNDEYKITILALTSAKSHAFSGKNITVKTLNDYIMA